MAVRPRVAAVDTRHQDFVHDIAYDFYGQRLATCASDLAITVFDWNAAAVRRGCPMRCRAQAVTHRPVEI